MEWIGWVIVIIGAVCWIIRPAIPAKARYARKKMKGRTIKIVKIDYGNDRKRGP